MTAQPTLFEPSPAGRVRHTDPLTSVQAARAQHGGAEAAVLSAFEAKRRAYPSLGAHGLTDDEVCDWCPTWHPPTLKSARSRLSKRGLLKPTGETRLSHRGRDQLVWRLG